MPQMKDKRELIILRPKCTCQWFQKAANWKNSKIQNPNKLDQNEELEQEMVPEWSEPKK